MSTHEGVPWAAELPLRAGAAAVEALPTGDLQQAVGWASIIVAAGFFIMGDLPNIGHHISPPRPVGLGATGTFFSRYLGPTSGYTVSSRNIQFHFGVIPNGRREALPYGSRIDLWDVCSWLEARAESTAQEPGR